MTAIEEATGKMRDKVVSGRAASIAADNMGHLKRVIPGGHGLEIGCFIGGGTKFLLENGMSKMDVIDTFKGSPEHQGLMDCSNLISQFSENTADYADRITPFKGRSDKILPALIVKGDHYDFIYVDGSHDSRDVILDAELSFKMLKRGGVMVFDDYEWDMYDDPYRNPRPAIDFFLACHASELEIIEKNYQVSLRKL